MVKFEEQHEVRKSIVKQTKVQSSKEEILMKSRKM